MYGEKKKVWTSISSKNYVWVVAVFFFGRARPVCQYPSQKAFRKIATQMSFWTSCITNLDWLTNQTIGKQNREQQPRKKDHSKRNYTHFLPRIAFWTAIILKLFRYVNLIINFAHGPVLVWRMTKKKRGIATVFSSFCVTNA